jgi:CDP-diacylglycerol pyrophosphatase
MSASENAEDLPRRQFLKLSGVAGTAAVVGGFGAVTVATAPAAQADVPCGKDSDGDSLWKHARDCKGQMPSDYCKGVNRNDVVIDGRPPPVSHDFLLVPVVRVRGIECPKLLGGFGAPYWKDAWDQAQPGGATPVTYAGGQVGLGINAKKDGALPPNPVRRHEQLHIHMAGISSPVVSQLKNAGIKNDVSGWKNKFVKIMFNGDTRFYRALQVASLNQNLFSLLHDQVVRPANEDMAIQMMIVTKSPGGWYVLNSNSRLPGQGGIGGTSTCDRLLIY